MKELLGVYYKGFAEKANWESVIADDFHFYDEGNMANTGPLIGKQAYIEMIDEFSQAFTGMRVKEMIIQNNTACVIGNYDFRFPNGKEQNGNVAEIWTAENGKLQSLAIYFDSLIFQQNS